MSVGWISEERLGKKSENKAKPKRRNLEKTKLTKSTEGRQQSKLGHLVT